MRNLILVFVPLIVLLLGCDGTSSKTRVNANDVPSSALISNQQIEEGMSIHEAALNGDFDRVKALISANIAVDIQDEEGRTALMYACFNGLTDIVAFLLDKGADVNKTDNYDRTPLMFASSGPFSETVRLLLKSGAYPNLVDGPDHFTALMYAASEGQLDVVRILLASNADPNLKDVDGDMAITFAKNNNHQDVVDELNKFK